MFDPSAPHIIILLIVVLLLFGSRRLPGAAKSLGESMHIFKKSVSGLNIDDQDGGNNASNNGPGYSASVLPPSAQPLASPQDATATQLQELQRQVDELQRQSASGSAGQQTQSF
jgi:sec-independent protein translocase protein TatA